MNVKYIRLLNGEELLSEVEETLENNDFIILKTPATVRVQPTGPNQLGISFLPFMPLADDDKSKNRVVELSKLSIVAIANPKIDILNEYNRLFGSNIILPTIDTSKLGL